MRLCQTRGIARRAVSACLLSSLVSVPAMASEIWVAPTYQADFGGLGVGSNVVWPVTPAGAVRLAWAVPGDLQTFESAKLVLIPQAAGVSTLTVYICPARQSELVTAACAGPFNHPFSGVANQLTEVDISATVAPNVGTPGATYLSVLAYTAPTTATDRIVGLRFAYAPMIPASVATLGANTFSGTQAAPAFVGDGSGLTNLPISTGGASLGSNTFTATQTIDGGNLDLDPSTPAGGNILKNGTRFMHTAGGEANLYVGLSAGNLAASLTNSVENTGVGHMALSSQLFGHDNTAVGANALRAEAGGAHNTAVGSGAMDSNTGGFHNTALGSGALNSNTFGTNNTSIGFASMIFNTTGDGNTALGVNGLVILSDGSFNLGVGDRAGSRLVTGSYNIYLGADPDVGVESNTMHLGQIGTQTRTFIAGVRGIATVNADALPVVIDSAGQLGTAAPNGIATLVSNTFTGTQTYDNGNLDLDHSTAAGGSLTKNGNRFLHNFGINNTFLGASSGNFTTTGQHNTAMGVGTLQNNTTGESNVAVGFVALQGNTTGLNNTAVGGGTLQLNASGSGNVAVGGAALQSNSSGGGNTASGINSLRDNTDGFDNVAAGSSALRFNTTGDRNAASGVSALHFNTLGNHNAAVGADALRANVTGSRNTGMGAFADVSSSALINATALGHGAIVDASNKVRLGNSSVTLVETAGDLRVGAGGTAGCVQDGDGTVLTGACMSDVRLKTDVTAFTALLDKLVALEPVRFRWKAQEYPDLQLGSAPSFGLIAQAAEKAFPELVAEDARGFKVVRYNMLPLMLLQAVKEQQEIIQRQQDETATLKARLDRLERAILQPARRD